MRIAWLFLMAACGHTATTTTPAAQSFRDGVQALCDLPDHVPEAATPEQRLSGAGAWADQHVTNADARKLGNLGSLALDKELLADAAQRAAITRCKLLDNGMALQSYTDAIKAVCAAPLGDRDKTAAYVRAHLLNAEVIRLVESIGTGDATLGRQKLRDSAMLAGLSDCALVASAGGPAVPQVQARDLPPADADAQTVVASESGIAIDGKQIVALDHGAVPAGELRGLIISHLKTALLALPHDKPLQLAIAPELPYLLLMQLRRTATWGNFETVALLVDTGDRERHAIAMLRAPVPNASEPQPDYFIAIVQAKGISIETFHPKRTVADRAELVEQVKQLPADPKRPRGYHVSGDPEVRLQEVMDAWTALHALVSPLYLETD